MQLAIRSYYSLSSKSQASSNTTLTKPSYLCLAVLIYARSRNVHHVDLNHRMGSIILAPPLPRPPLPRPTPTKPPPALTSIFLARLFSSFSRQQAATTLKLSSSPVPWYTIGANSFLIHATATQAQHSSTTSSLHREGTASASVAVLRVSAPSPTPRSRICLTIHVMIRSISSFSLIDESPWRRVWAPRLLRMKPQKTSTSVRGARGFSEKSHILPVMVDS